MSRIQNKFSIPRLFYKYVQDVLINVCLNIVLFNAFIELLMIPYIEHYIDISL